MNESINVEVLAKESSRFSTYSFVKRLFDIFVSIIGIFILEFVVVFIKIAYVLSGDFDSIFYTQKRVGKDGKIFKLHKIRSMVPNADEILEKTLEMDPILNEQWKKNHKLDNDPRVTKIGKIIRKLSLDELPQFVNVLFGEMSIIGPRPLVPGELDEHCGDHEIYERVKPGITGWWACNGRSDTDYDERLELEYYYCNHASIALDIKCFFKTIEAVLKKKGAK